MWSPFFLFGDWENITVTASNLQGLDWERSHGNFGRDCVAGSGR
jgi:hypothetical protein